ncbi:MAG: BrnT family toxin [Hyphomicrobiales bacterium]|nr:BrnT family toxin [Hyphomicrobiales bacterium]
MTKDIFEWDPRKSAANFAKHGVTFEMVREVFRDAFAIENFDDRENYGEPRYTIIGMVEGRLLFVAFTMRDDTYRIISARGAEPHEQRQYHEDNA